MSRSDPARLDLTSESAATRAPTRDPLVGYWLIACAAMVFAMAVIGAITRLTESGLSIMEWAPLTGALPPLSQAEWQRIFEIYQQIPEYRELNAGMTLDEFKTIFWWEYIHRLWGRLIGLVFLVPFLCFLVARRLRRDLVWPLIGIFVLGGLQGGMGWFMVASGFADRTDVSQYRLVAHLMLAVAIYIALLWVGFGLLAPRAAQGPAAPGLRRGVLLLAALILVTIASGGFVAGLNAGLIYNSFPLMGGDLVPHEYGAATPWAASHFEEPATVQFNHRVLAVTTALAALGLWLWSRRAALAPPAAAAMNLVLLVALLQVGLGIATLLALVPVWLGALHQAGALLLLTVTLWALYRLRIGDS